MRLFIFIKTIIFVSIISSCKSIATFTPPLVTIDCCPDKYYYQNTDVLPKYTFAETIIIGENVIPFAPQGPVKNGDGQFKYFSASSFMEFQPGSELSLSEYLVTGFCDENLARNNHSTINPIRIPNVITPNGDGINDYFMVNANSTTYVVLEIYQRVNSRMKRIYRSEKDINSNYTVLWDGIQGVNSSSFSNQNQFFL